MHAQPAAKPAGAAQAATTESRPTWDSLTQTQQEALAPLKGEWRVIDSARKQKWLEIASRMPTMSATDRERIQQRMAEWVRMSPADRGRARIQFQEAQQVAPTERQGRWEAYQALPADQRQALAVQSAARRPAVAGSAAAAAPARSPASGAAERPRTAAASVDVKRNVVPLAASQAATRQVAPTVVQVKPGATTSLVTTPVKPPAHHQAGLPKVNASADFVNPSTLLPLRGPQGAAVAAVPASGSASSP